MSQSCGKLNLDLRTAVQTHGQHGCLGFLNLYFVPTSQICDYSAAQMLSQRHPEIKIRSILFI